MQPPKYRTGMARVVWVQVISFELQPQIYKNYNGVHIQGMHRMMLKYSHVSISELIPIAEQKTPRNAENASIDDVILV